MEPPAGEVTQLLRSWSAGDPLALERLTPLVYEELRRIAERHMRRENPGNTLQTTALVNEAYVRLVDVKGMQWQDRAHFFAVSAQLMRRILVDAARARSAGKRGGHAQKMNLDESIVGDSVRDGKLIELDEALKQLAEFDERRAKVVEMRFFGGLTVEETAEVLNISSQSVMRDWKLARGWLMRQLTA